MKRGTENIYKRTYVYNNGTPVGIFCSADKKRFA